jgi:hypothetical protein
MIYTSLMFKGVRSVIYMVCFVPTKRAILAKKAAVSRIGVCNYALCKAPNITHICPHLLFLFVQLLKGNSLYFENEGGGLYDL